MPHRRPEPRLWTVPAPIVLGGPQILQPDAIYLVVEDRKLKDEIRGGALVYVVIPD
jgi:hypothetical protein